MDKIRFLALQTIFGTRSCPPGSTSVSEPPDLLEKNSNLKISLADFSDLLLEPLRPEAPKMGFNPLGACILPMLDDAFVSQPFSIGAGTAYALLWLHLGFRFCLARLPVPIQNPCP